MAYKHKTPGTKGGSGGKGRTEDGESNNSAVIENLRKLKGDDDEEKTSPYQYLDKAAVLQECKVFHDSTVVMQDPRKCCLLITKLLFLLVRGEIFTSLEITEVFFGVTKLFQSADVNLRRMMYLFIKEIAETCNPDDVIIVVASLVKDMNTGEDLYKANSMRVLAKIIDPGMLGAIERYLKQAIVDKNAFVASSALMAGLSLFDTCPDVVRRWINEVQETVTSSNDMVQYHSLSLLYKIKQHDRLAVSKTVQQLSKGSLRSPLATCLLIRYTSGLLREDMNSTNARAAYQFLESCLRHKHDMVIYEAAKAICNLPGVEASDLSPAITVLQLFLPSQRSSLRFAAIRCLSEVATRHPASLAKCNDDMEALVSDSNRSIATLAITTLLKTGTESNIERLMKQINSFMGEISDEFKVVVVKAVRELCMKYPQKNKALVGFMAAFLRDEGGFEFKKSIVDAILDLMVSIPETKETSLFHLCEFIEDCEYDELIIQVLHVVGKVGPTTSAPSRYIRFVFNRVILEVPYVRAAAVNTLGAFATQIPELRPSILLLLERSITDDDDEVRDRAATLVTFFSGQVNRTDDQRDSNVRYMLDERMPLTFTMLERSVKSYLASSASDSRPISFATLPVVEEQYVPVTQTTKSKAAVKPSAAASAAAGEADSVDVAAAVYKIPEFTSYGRAFKSCPDVPLTESEMEYVVNCTKHIFSDHIVLQYSVLNTVDDQRLVDAFVEVGIDDDCIYEVDKVIPAPCVRYGEASNCFVSLKRKDGEEGIGQTVFECALKFKLVQVDPNNGEIEGDPRGYDEEYALENLELNTKDFMTKVMIGDFRRSWDDMGTEGEVLEKFALQFKKLGDAVTAVLDFLGMQPADGTGKISAIDETKKTHTLHLGGRFLVDNAHVLVRAQLQLDDAAGVVLKMAVRCDNKEISELVTECIR